LRQHPLPDAASCFQIPISRESLWLGFAIDHLRLG
jgi:hypothetical protein